MIPPYARLLLSIDGAASASGGLTVDAEASIQPSYESTAGWPATPPPYLEIFEFPDGWEPVPSTGWVETTVTQANGQPASTWRYYGTTPPPAFDAPDLDHWGKVGFLLMVGGGKKAGALSSDMRDESTWVSVLSDALELEGLGFREEAQFGDHKQWVGGDQRDRKKIEAYLSAGGGLALAATNMIAGTGLTGGGTLAADRTFNVVANADGSIVSNANDIQVGILASDSQHGVRGGGTQHAVAIAAGAAGFMSGADKTKLDGITSGAAVASVAVTAPITNTGSSTAPNINFAPVAAVPMNGQGFTGCASVDRSGAVLALGENTTVTAIGGSACGAWAIESSGSSYLRVNSGTLSHNFAGVTVMSQTASLTTYTTRVDAPRFVSAPDVVVCAPTTTLDLSRTQHPEVLIDQITTIAFSNAVAGMMGTIELTQNPTGYAVTMPAAGAVIEYATGTTTAVDTTADRRTTYTYKVRTGGRICILAQAFTTPP